MGKKKSFVFYYDWRDIFEPFDNETMGLLLRAVLSYAIDKKEPEFDDLALQISFNFIKSAFDRDSEKYNKICEKNAKNAKLGGRPRKPNGFQINQTDFEKPDNDNVNDKDNENENDNENVNDKLKSLAFSEKTARVYSDDFLVFWKEYPKKVGKGEAFKQWKKSKINKGDFEDIFSALHWQKRSERWKSAGGRYIPNPSTYISQRRWEDEPDGSLSADITDPTRYTDGDELPDFIMKGEF